MKNEELSPERYAAAFYFLRLLRDHKDSLTRQQVQTLRGQALAGDVDGAMRGLGRMLLEKETKS